MELKEKDVISITQKLKDELVRANFKLGEDKIFTIQAPAEGLPDDFLLITNNSSFLDSGDIAQVVILVEINSKLLPNKMINKVRIKYLFDSLSNIFRRPLIVDNLTFVVSKQYNIFDTIDVSLGYGVRMLNLVCTVTRQLNY